MMKKVLAVTLSLLLCLTASAGLAATAPGSAKNTWADWLRQGISLLEDTARSGWEFIQGEAPRAAEAVRSWLETVEAFFTTNGAEISRSVQEAWDMLKKGAEQAGSVAGEKLTEAYRTVKQWIENTAGANDGEAQKTLETLEDLYNAGMGTPAPGTASPTQEPAGAQDGSPV